jgi:hypothetical protein
MDLADRKKASELLVLAGKKITASYFDVRQGVEQWLRAEAIRKGVVATSKSPPYFRLYSHPVTALEQPDVMYINLPAGSIPARLMSFTVEDSFHNYAQLKVQPYPHTPAGLVADVLTADELRKRINSQGFPPDLDGKDPQRYIECQVWDELPVFDRATLVAGHIARQAVIMDGIQA